MSVAENIDTAVSSLWQLAIAMASLKAIAGMNGQEEDLASADTEDDHSLPNTHSYSYVEKTEESSDDNFANMENTESEEIELAALISSLTLTMVCQQNKAPGMNVIVPKELIKNVDQTAPESIPISSMVGHQLPELDSPLDISEMPLSMAAHGITANIEEGEYLCDAHENISMIAKKDRTAEEFNCKEEDDISEISTLSNGKQTETIFSESEVSTNSPEENLTVYEASMCTHKLSCQETPLPLTQYQVSMVAHQHSITENNLDSGSLVCHQAPTHQNESTQRYEIETNPTKHKVDSALTTTLLAHQVLPVDTYLESSELPISMAAHMIISYGDEETFYQANENVSMVVHQIVNEETHNTAIKKAKETVEDLCDYITTEDEEKCIIRESKFISSLCSHQLSRSETPLENTKYPVLLSVHTMDNYSEFKDMSLKPEHGMINSMLSHQSCQEENFVANLKEEELTSNNHLNILPTDCDYQQIDQNSNFHSSVAHQLPSLAAECGFITSLASTVAHGALTGTSEADIIDLESGVLTSILSHQFPAFSDDVDAVVYIKDHLKASNNLTERIEFVETTEHSIIQEGTVDMNLPISMATHQLPDSEVVECLDSTKGHRFISDVDDNTNTNSLVSMAAHITDSMLKESNEAAPINEENMKNHYQGKRPDREKEEDIAQQLQHDISIQDNHTRLSRLTRISENNVEANETHIVNNFKGVEFKSSIIVHQQLDEEYETEDPEDIRSDDESVSSEDDSIQSMLTTTEKINHLNTFEDLTSENAHENLIAGSCTIEDNSPVVIKTSDQIMDETNRIASRETEKFKVNQQVEIYENEMGQHLLTKDSEEDDNSKINNQTGILRSLSSEAKANGKSKKTEKSQKSSTQIASFNANSGKQTYKIRFKVKPNEDPSKSSVLKYLLGYFRGQQ